MPKTATNPLFGLFDQVVHAAVTTPSPAKFVIGKFWPKHRPLKYADLFCGIGGFHTAAAALGLECVFACDIDEECRKSYSENYGMEPKADIRTVDVKDIP